MKPGALGPVEAIDQAEGILSDGHRTFGQWALRTWFATEPQIHILRNRRALILHDSLTQETGHVVCLGEPSALSSAFSDEAVELMRPGWSVVAPHGTWEPLGDLAHRVTDASRWVWMCTGARPIPVALLPTGIQFVEFSAKTRLEVDAFQRTHLPNSYLTTHAPDARWFGLRHDGEVIGIIGATGWEVGAVHLGSFVLEREWRGKGLGETLMRQVITLGLDHGPLVSLGVLRSNSQALRLYKKLGFRTAYEVDSLTLLS